MSRYSDFNLEHEDEAPSFKGNLVRRFVDPQEIRREEEDYHSQNALWHWNPLIGKAHDPESDS
jgi:hypothetical protein